MKKKLLDPSKLGKASWAARLKKLGREGAAEQNRVAANVRWSAQNKKQEALP